MSQPRRQVQSEGMSPILHHPISSSRGRSGANASLSEISLPGSDYPISPLVELADLGNTEGSTPGSNPRSVKGSSSRRRSSSKGVAKTGDYCPGFPGASPLSPGRRSSYGGSNNASTATPPSVSRNSSRNSSITAVVPEVLPLPFFGLQPIKVHRGPGVTSNSSMSLGSGNPANGLSNGLSNTAATYVVPSASGGPPTQERHPDDSIGTPLQFLRSSVATSNDHLLMSRSQGNVSTSSSLARAASTSLASLDSYSDPPLGFIPSSDHLSSNFASINNSPALSISATPRMCAMSPPNAPTRMSPIGSPNSVYQSMLRNFPTQRVSPPPQGRVLPSLSK